jgi:hypothetical protein
LIDLCYGKKLPSIVPTAKNHTGYSALTGLLTQAKGEHTDDNPTRDDFRRLLAATFANEQTITLRVAGVPGRLTIGIGLPMDKEQRRNHLEAFLPGLRIANKEPAYSPSLPIRGSLSQLPRLPPDFAGAYGVDWARLLNTLSREQFELLIDARPVDRQQTGAWLKQIWRIKDECHTRAQRTQGSQSQTGQSTQESSQPNVALRFWRGVSGGVIANGSSQQSSQMRSWSNEEIDSHAMELEQLAASTADRFLQGLKTGLWQVELSFSCADKQTAQRIGSLLTGELSVKDRDALPLQIDISQATNGPDGEMRGSTMTTEELAGLIGLPSRSVPGFSVAATPMLETNVSALDGARLGELMHLAAPNGVVCALSREELLKHILVSGITGSGKTHTVHTLLTGAELPFMVLELAKREYRRLRSRFDNLLVFTPGDARIAPIAINPLFVLPGCSAVAHIDHLKPLFVAAFGLYGPMPQLLADALEHVYEAKGWDMVTGSHPVLEAVYEYDIDGEWCSPEFSHLFPILPELSLELERRVNAAGYQGEVLGNIKAALQTRLRGLSSGAKGQIFVTHRAFDLESLLGERVVFELEGLADDADKAFFSGLVLTYIAQWRQRNTPLRQLKARRGGAEHILVIEEAHRFLRREGATRLGEMDANPREHAIEFFSNMLSELRATGQSVVIAEQIPSKIAPDVIKNTGTKIVHRLVAADDQRAMATTLGLNEIEAGYLNELVTGEALVCKEGMSRAAKVRVDRGEQPQALVDRKVREWMNNNRFALNQDDARYVDWIGRHLEAWDLAALRLLIIFCVTEFKRQSAIERVRSGLPVAIRQWRQEHINGVSALLANRLNALLAHGVFASTHTDISQQVALYRLTVALVNNSEEDAETLRQWRKAIASQWGVATPEQGVAPRVAELILQFIAQNEQARRDAIALEGAIKHFAPVEAPAFKQWVMQIVARRMGDQP